MDWLFIFKISWAFFSVLVLSVVLVILARFGSIFRWKRALKEELDILATDCAEDYIENSARHSGIEIIRNKCLEIFVATSPEIIDLKNIPDFVAKIAACYHPESERPELEVSIGSIARSLDLALSRFESIMDRPGFWRLRSVRIRHLKDSLDYYEAIAGTVIWKWYQKYRKRIQTLLKLNLYLVPDPFSWLAYLSRRLLLLLLTKCLLADIYLFVGKLALNSYDIERNTASGDENETLENALEGLCMAADDKEDDVLSGLSDPELVELRKRLISFRNLIVSNPTFGEWKNAVIEAARIIAGKHFPESERPVEEAAIGPLVERGRHWISTFRKAEDYPLIGKFYGVRLKTLRKAKNYSTIITGGRLWPVIGKAGKLWSWLKWPWKAYRLARKASPWGIAADIGWAGARKAGLAYLCHKTFTLACFELEQVYKESGMIADKKKGRGLFQMF